MEVSSLTLHDSRHAAFLHHQAFLKGWDQNTFLNFLKDPLIFGLKIQNNKNFLGYILWREVAGEAEILTLVIAESDRRKGLASKLMTHLCRHLQGKNIHTLFLEVAEDNLKAISFYQKHGFNFLGKRPHYYPRKVNLSVSALNFSKKII